MQPALYSMSAVLVVWLCAGADWFGEIDWLPEIDQSLVETLMQVLTASMLGVATFAVASMVAAYASVGTNATPRAFALIVSDDVSKRALSSFVGAFIFGTIGVIAMNLQFYDKPGRFALFCVTLLVYGWVIWIFVRWVDSIVRLGRMETAIKRVEDATGNALKAEARNPLRGAMEYRDIPDDARDVFAGQIGYIRDIDMPQLQDIAEKQNATIHVVATEGSFVGPGRPVARIVGGKPDNNDQHISDAFYVGRQRWFQSDPRFGFVALAQIASRALSPGVNDPGTAIDVLGAGTRLLLEWSKARRKREREVAEERPAASLDRVHYPGLLVDDLLEDAFTAIARDGAGQVEVMLRLQRDLQLLAAAGDAELAQAAVQFSEHALKRSRLKIEYAGDEKAIVEAAARVQEIHAKDEKSVE